MEYLRNHKRSLLSNHQISVLPPGKLVHNFVGTLAIPRRWNFGICFFWCFDDSGLNFWPISKIYPSFEEKSRSWMCGSWLNRDALSILHCVRIWIGIWTIEGNPESSIDYIKVIWKGIRRRRSHVLRKWCTSLPRRNAESSFSCLIEHPKVRCRTIEWSKMSCLRRV